MLREKIVEWIGKTFGKHRAGDRFEMSSKIAELSKNGMKIRVEELNFVFQRRKTDISEKEVKNWKKELDELTGNSLRGFHFENGELIGMASGEDIEKGAQAGELVTGRSSLLSVGIYKEDFIAKEVLFPHKLTSDRRH